MLDQLATTLKRNMLKWHAGHEMFCPKCQNILDARRAVEIDFIDVKTRRPIKSVITCANCFDSTLKPNLEAMKLPDNVTVEVNDGRVLFARPKRAKKAPKVTEMPAAEQLPLTA